MTRTRWIVLVGGLVAVGLVVALTQGRGPEEAVRSRTAELVEMVRRDGEESPLEAAAVARRFAGYFVEEPYIEYFPGRTALVTQQHIQTAVLALRGNREAGGVSLANHRVQVADNEQSAISYFTANFEGHRSAGGSRRSLDYQVEWTLIEGQWRIRNVTASTR